MFNKIIRVSQINQTRLITFCEIGQVYKIRGLAFEKNRIGKVFKKHRTFLGLVESCTVDKSSSEMFLYVTCLNKEMF